MKSESSDDDAALARTSTDSGLSDEPKDGAAQQGVHTAFRPIIPPAAAAGVMTPTDPRILRLPAFMCDHQTFAPALGLAFHPSSLLNYFSSISGLRYHPSAPPLPPPPPPPHLPVYPFRHQAAPPTSGGPSYIRSALPDYCYSPSSAASSSSTSSSSVGCGRAARDLLSLGVEWLKTVFRQGVAQGSPCFVDLPLRDQVTLLEESWCELFLLSIAQEKINPGEQANRPTVTTPWIE